MQRRDVINDAIERLEKAGYAPQGDVEIWNIGLQRKSDAQIRYGVQLVMEQHQYKTIRPSHIVQMIESEVFQGAGKSDGLDPAKWQFWKDDKGREFAYHPNCIHTAPRKS